MLSKKVWMSGTFSGGFGFFSAMAGPPLASG
jgi:hypothetical protein